MRRPRRQKSRRHGNLTPLHRRLKRKRSKLHVRHQRRQRNHGLRRQRRGSASLLELNRRQRAYPFERDSSQLRKPFEKLSSTRIMNANVWPLLQQKFSAGEICWKNKLVYLRLKTLERLEIAAAPSISFRNFEITSMTAVHRFSWKILPAKLQSV